MSEEFTRSISIIACLLGHVADDTVRLTRAGVVGGGTVPEDFQGSMN